MVIYWTEISRTRLYEGALLGTIAHAIWIVQNPEFAFEHSWEDGVYNVNDSTGGLGSIAFDEDNAVGVFFDASVAENPIEVSPLFDGLPGELDDLKAEALAYMHQRVDGGDSAPMATTAFWTDSGRLAASDPWSDVLRKGAHLVRIQLLPHEEAIEAWRENYGFSDTDVDLLLRIFDERRHRNGVVTLEERDAQQLENRSDSGMAESVTLLEDVGITLPRDRP